MFGFPLLDGWPYHIYHLTWPWHTTLLTIAVSSPGAGHRCQAWSRTIEAFRRRLGIWCFFLGGFEQQRWDPGAFWWCMMRFLFPSISWYFPNVSSIFRNLLPPKSTKKSDMQLFFHWGMLFENARSGRNWPPNLPPSKKTLRNHSVWSPTGSRKRMVPVMFLAPKDESMRFAAEID